MKKELFFKEILLFLKQNIIVIFASIVITCISFLFMLTHNIILIDEEFFQTTNSNPQIFLHLSRWTDYLYSKIFFNGRIFYFWTDFVAIIFLNISAILFLKPYFEKCNKIIKVLSISIFTTIPFCVGQNFAFSHQIIPISISMCFTAISFLYTINNLNNKFYYFLSIVFLCLSIGSYQSFICVYISSCASFCLYQILNKKNNLYVFKKGIFILISSMILYLSINIVFGRYFNKTDYLYNTYFMVDKKNFFKLLFLSIANIIRVNFAIPIYQELIYGGFVIRTIYTIFIVFLIYFLKKEKENKLLIVFYYVIFFISPYILYIFMLTYKTQGRMMISLSITCACQILIIYKFINKKYKNILIFLSSIFLIYNIVLNNLSFKTAYDVYKNDISIIKLIEKNIYDKNIDISNKKLIIIGNIKNKNNSYFKNVTIGASFFEWDGGNINRIRELFSLEGINFLMPNNYDIKYALEISKKYPFWPSSDSIFETRDLLIIKLSDPSDKWYKTNIVE